MSLKACVLGSGSKGNSIFVASEKTNILVDVGLPIIRIEKSLAVLGVDPKNVNILITHEHSDHIKSLASFVKKYDSNAYASIKSYYGISRFCDVENRNFHWFNDDDFCVGEMEVSPFEVSHDVPCYGYRIDSFGKRMAVATDIGEITVKSMRGMEGCDLAILESNHDMEMLTRNRNYPEYLKKRILSTRGHLSNIDCGVCACDLAANGTKQFVLAHLSEENNCPELAYETVKNMLYNDGTLRTSQIEVEVASQDRMSGLFVIK